ncbi:ketopantoate reductase PanE/ApbA-domain-containing protein [Lentinula aciculospora]|uniref:Ketopantoate reductase PanE/ApbA-domain-containing protein n=1 Tax=Lentinula aciculospora TaxID=153920 RepID=A0A9W9AUU6_9AGAR|nr:ketopantoate reductase PanE/ApbA-domain-containing protein [Lentinula aciculospora]
MTSSPKEILLVGFGAIGSIYAFCLNRSALARVTVVARSNYALINDYGVHIKSRRYGDIPGWKPDRLCKSVSDAANQKYDYVIVTSKALPDIIATSTMLLPLISSSYTERFGQPTYALLQNGLDVEKDLYDSLMALGEKPKIISTSVYIMTNITAPGEVEHLSMTDPIFLGIYRHGDYTTCVNSPGETNVLEGLAVPLSCGGFQAQVVPEIQRKKLAKNMINVVFASTATLTNYTVPALFRPAPEKGSASYDPYLEPKTASSINEYTIPTLHAMLVEMVSLARALGFPDTDDGFPSSLVDETIANQRRMHEDPQNSHVPSMLLDARNGQLIEVEAIVGSVVRIAHERGVSVTRIETLYALLLVIQNQAVRRKLLSSSS